MGFSNAPGSLAAKNYDEVFRFATMCVAKYLQYASPSTVGIAADIAADIIETRPTWKLADFILCFKFLRQNAGQNLPKNTDPNCIVYKKDAESLKVFGNIITGTKLMEMIALYEETRVVEFEKCRKESLPTSTIKRTAQDTSVKSLMGRMAEDAAAKREQLRLKGQLHDEKKVAPDEDYFKREHGV